MIVAGADTRGKSEGFVTMGVLRVERSARSRSSQSRKTLIKSVFPQIILKSDYGPSDSSPSSSDKVARNTGQQTVQEIADEIAEMVLPVVG